MSDEEAIRQVLHDFLRPFEDGDVESMLEYYADDMVWMFPNSPTDATKAAARDFYQSAFDRGTFTDNEVKVHEIEVVGEWAFARVTAQGRFTPHGEQQGPIRGSRHLTLFRKQSDGGWKIARDIFNNPEGI